MSRQSPSGCTQRRVPKYLLINRRHGTSGRPRRQKAKLSGTPSSCQNCTASLEPSCQVLSKISRALASSSVDKALPWSWVDEAVSPALSQGNHVKTTQRTETLQLLENFPHRKTHDTSCVPVDILFLANDSSSSLGGSVETFTDDSSLDRNVESSKFSSSSSWLLSSISKRSPSSDATPRECSAAHKYAVSVNPATSNVRSCQNRGLQISILLIASEAACLSETSRADARMMKRLASSFLSSTTVEGKMTSPCSISSPWTFMC